MRAFVRRRFEGMMERFETTGSPLITGWGTAQVSKSPCEQLEQRMIADCDDLSTNREAAFEKIRARALGTMLAAVELWR